MDDKLVIEQYTSLPEQLKKQVADFIAFLKQKEQSAPAQRSLATKKPVFGSYKGTFEMGDDFDEPLEDFKDYMP